MKNKKLWLSLDEAAQVIGCSVAHLLYLGVTGELKHYFDWAVIKSESNLIEPKSRPYFNFLEIINITPCPHTGKDVPLDCPVDPPNYKLDPLLRLAYLTSDDIALIGKNTQITLKSASLSEITHISIDCREYKDNHFNSYDDNEDDYVFPTLKLEHIVIKVSDLEVYQTPRAIEQKPAIESPREIENLTKLIGLLTTALADKSGNSLNHGEKISAAAVASKVEMYFTHDINIDGLSRESIRKKVSAGLKSIDAKFN